MSSPTDWPQFYHQNLSEATGVVSTTTITSSGSGGPSSLASVVPSASSSGGGGHLSPEGRVGKPVRRRSRASRRTPTTLLNTDTANFRAMVQQFTGSPTAPFASSAGIHPTNIGFSFGGRHQAALVNNPAVAGSLMVNPPAGGFHLQYQQHHQQQQQPQFQQHQNQPYMFSLNNNNNNQAGAADHLFFQRLGGNPRPNMEGAAGVGSEGFVVEGVSSSQVPAPSPRNNFFQ